MSTLTESRGVFVPGTTKKKTVSMYDTQGTQFVPLPDGPYEVEAVHDQPTAQEHFNSTREIKLIEAQGFPLPTPSYKDHYPPKMIPEVEKGLELQSGNYPFTSRTEHMDQFFNKPRMPRPVDPLSYQHKPMPWTGNQTTNQAHYKPFVFGPGNVQSAASSGRAATAPPAAFLPNDYSTTYSTQFVPKEAGGRVPAGIPELHPPMPWLAGQTTYQDHFLPKEMMLVPIVDPEQVSSYPFAGSTEYRAEYEPKERLPQVPPLTGLVSKDGLTLPLPRRSLGVEFWHRGKPDNFFILLPRHVDAPCSARQVFTTLHDNQEQACILVLYGDDPVASNNVLLGQFNIINIPPAPKDVPRIEVKFHLSKDLRLTAEARDLDTGRHKLWEQRGAIIVLKS
ncbi:hypothetical protein CEUSTIGMA_g1753.t1 [Chlamydomonas eustigma]|uniref:Uncharacterized protein n=1 Tax=Chlamydomonas eustigma TaxID=1157962 RepID=A0A250WU14_9CHLO|nr:hypothetical protein CEUSTIGMA_g1753.t1 [Chlamydomonas eustigma]|eukprot:GAX74304.1 hypothetical protein CEUSTIGMA_g1753.t1 [Chlamydomonas eustigma]